MNIFTYAIVRKISTGHQLYKSMPLNLELVQERQFQRARNKSKKSKTAANAGAPGTCYLAALSNGTRGSPGCLYVFSGLKRYLFNCGEGIQRLAAEHKTKIKDLEHVFFTYKNWENIGGLPGLTLSLQDIGVTELYTHGPSQIPDIYHMSKKFLNASEIKVRHYESNIYSDHAMAIKAVSMKSSKHHQGSQSPEDSPNSSQKVKRLKRSCEDVATAYICKLPTKFGALNFEKCVEYGVPPGPLLGKLKNKEDIELPDGRVILSSSVTAPDEPGPAFIVVECPTIDFLESLRSCTEWERYQTGEEDDIAKCVVHFTPRFVMEDPIYQSWMAKFPPSTFHMALNDSNSSSNSVTVHKMHYKLNTLHSTIFPLPKTTLKTKPLPILAKYYLRPTPGLRGDESPDIDTQKFLDELIVEDSNLLEKECEKLKNIIEKTEQENISNLKDQIFPEVVFLGTGSSIPSEYRNASGMLVKLSPSKNIILDAGEGSFGQLMHAFGPEEIDTILKNISCIYISHPHADHHLGLIQFLKERKKAFQQEPYQRLYLAAPQKLESWLTGYHKSFEPISYLYTMIPNSFLLPNNQNSSKFSNLVEEMLDELSLKKISTVRVKHCHDAYGVIIINNKGWKIVYSGDTMPCQNLVEAGCDCDVLIHEATLQDEMKEEAVYKCHSTTSEAIKIGEKMNARFTILTHFSQRYSKLPIFNESFTRNIGVAFDNMRVRPCDLPLLSLFQDSLKAMFAEDYEEMQEATEKRLRNKEFEKLKAAEEAR